MALKKNKALKRSKKGILLTLLTIVLFVLMLGELITYVILNINYTNIASQASQSLNAGSFVSNLNSSISNFMHSSLNNALYSAIYYEGNPPLRKDYFINNTAFVLSTLMQNGTINGYNMSSRTGETLSMYIKTLEDSASTQNIAMNITNGSLHIYQASAFAIGASYTALASVNQSGTVSTYPIYANTSVSVAFKPDLASVEQGANATLVPYKGYPKAQLIGNAYAKAGSMSPFMFVYGMPAYVSGEPKCSGILPSVENANYILVTPDAADINQSVCNMGGLITNITNATTPLKPYLLYSNATVINDTKNYSSVLLNGPGLAAYSLSTLKNAITNGYYFATNYTPDYLESAQGSINQVSNYGLASFNLLNRETAYLNGSSTIATGLPISSTYNFTVTLWIKPKSLAKAESGNGYTVLNSQGTNNFEMWLNNGGGSTASAGSGDEEIGFGSNYYRGYGIGNSTWSFVAVGVSNGIATFYTNNMPAYTIKGIIAGPYSIDDLTLGQSAQSISQLNGSIANVQVYNSMLTSSQLSNIYMHGINAIPESNSKLVAWYPLNGNANDYSGYNDNGVPTNVVYVGLHNYTYDPLSRLNVYAFSKNVADFNLTKGSWISSHAVVLPDGANTATITAWIKPKIVQGDSTYAGIVRIDGNAGSGTGLLLSLQGSSGLPSMATWSNDFVPSSGPKVNYNAWNFVAVRINGTDNALLYVNGHAESGTLSSSLVPSLKSGGYSTNFSIGSTDSPGRLFNGSISNVQVYNASLNISQLQRIYEKGINAGPVNNTNLVGWWPLDGNANDYSGYDNNGTPIAVSFNALPNDPTSNLVEGIFNCTSMNWCSSSTIQHLYLNSLPLAYAGKGFMNETTALGLPYGGISDVANFNGGHITIPHSSSYAVNAAFSISWWFNSAYPSTTTFDSEMLSSRQPTDETFDMQLIGGTSPQLHGDIGTGAGSWLSTNVNYGFSFNQSQWYNVVTVFSSTGWSIFLNGKNVSSGTYSGTPSLLDSNSYLDIGSGNGASFFDGSIADAQIYNIALSSAQVQDLYLNNTVSGATPVAYWPLSTGSNGMLNQTSDIINGNTGYLYSGSGQCTVVEVADGTCGVEYAQP